MCSGVYVGTEQPEGKESSTPAIEIIKTSALKSSSLSQFLWNRRIPVAVATKFCQEAQYELGGKAYCAIAFPNDSGGFTLLNRYHDYPAGPQGPALFSWGANRLAVFTHFLDLLTLVTHLPGNSMIPDLLVLPATEPSLPTHYPQVHLFLRNDSRGEMAAMIAASTPSTIINHQPLYRGYKSLNDWACHIGQAQPHRPT